MLPFVVNSIEPDATVLVVLPTCKLNTALPAVEVAITVTEPVEADEVKLTAARPFAVVFTVVEVSPPVIVPAPVVTTSNETGIPAIGMPRLFTAMTSRFFGAFELGLIDWLLPLVMSNIELDELVVPTVAVVKVKTAVPAVEVAMTVTGPVLLEAVNTVLALPLELVVALATVLPPVRVPEPLVTTSNFTATPGIATPRLFTASTSRLLVPAG